MAITRRRLIASTPGLLSAPVAAQPAWIAAAPRLWRPDRIALKLDTSLAERDFLPLLEAELQARFTAEVVVGKSHLPLDEHRRANGQVVADTLLPAELRELGWTSPPRHVHLCLVGDDLVLGRWNFAFSASIGDLDRQIGLVVISLHRMMSPAPEAQLPDGWPGLTAERVLRLAAKNIVRSAGYGAGSGCILATPMDLAELTAMDDDFCQPERTHLEAAGILRPRL